MKISVITVARNSEKHIKNCIISVNNQDYHNIEHILIDGKSTDSTLKIFKRFAKRNPKFVSESDNGIYDAMNKGIDVASGDIIGFLNSDDIFTNKGIISLISNTFSKNKIDAVYGNLVYVNKKNKITRVWKSNKFTNGLFGKSWTPAHPTFYCLKSIYIKYGKYRTDYKISSDVDLMIRFLELNQIRSLYLSKTMVCMLDGGISNSSFLSTIIITKEIIKSHKDYNLKFNIFKYLLFKLIKKIKQKKF